MPDLLDTMLVELAELTQTAATLEEQQEDIRLRLGKIRALQVELLGAADLLNRQRHKTALAPAPMPWTRQGPQR